MRTAIAIGLVCCFLANAAAQDKKSDEALVEALQKLDVRVFEKGSNDAKARANTFRQMREEVNKQDVAEWRKIQTKADWEAFRDVRIAALRQSLGRFPPAPRRVDAIITNKIAGEGFTVENLLYESRPGLYVTANLYVPGKRTRAMPGLIIIHSHHNPKTQGELQDMGMTWARLGCLVLIPDMLGHGERRQHPFVDATSFPQPYKVGRQDYYFRYNVAQQLSLIGESLMGWMVWDLMCGLDVLYQQPGIDKSKIVVLGSVAAGGDSCAVFAALDPRVSAAAPFNFGGPQPETRFPLPEDGDLAFNYMGGGSWESTRNLPLSGRDGFLPWVIVGSLAPRGLIYGHEFAWDKKRDPVWARLEKIWSFYDPPDKLASAEGRGAVTGKPPEATHCNNIGPEHRKQIYPVLEKWFGLEVPTKEYQKRFNAADLQCWTEATRAARKPSLVHELALAQISVRTEGRAPSGAAELKSRIRKVLGLPADDLKSRVEAVGAEQVVGNPNGMDGCHIRKLIFRSVDSSRSHAVPAVLLVPEKRKRDMPIVIGLAQDGKAGFLRHRAETIARLLASGVAICLPDLGGTGETRADGRGRQSGSTSISATALMHGEPVFASQLRELQSVMSGLESQGFGPMALWGDSFALPNDAKMNFAVPHDADKMPGQSEPNGALLALFAGALQGDRVKAVYVRGGLVSFRSMLETPFCYFPHEAVLPGILNVLEVDDLLSGENAMRPLWLESLVDGVNRRVDQKRLGQDFTRALSSRDAKYPVRLREESSSPSEVATWLSEQVRR